MKVKLGLDKMRCRLYCPYTELRRRNRLDGEALIYAWAMDVVLGNVQKLRKGAWSRPHAQHSFQMSYCPLLGGGYLYMTIGYHAPTKKYYIMLDFNPAKMNQLDWLDLCEAQLGCFLPSAYVSLFVRAAISYIEIPLDVYGGRKKDYLFFDERAQTFAEKHDPVNKLVLGSPAGRRYTVIYQKRCNLLRIEPRLRQGILMRSLAEIESPFDTVWVIDIARLREAELGAAGSFFRGLVLDRGFAAQDAYEFSVDKKTLMQELSACMAEWYDRKAIWDQFPAVAHSLSLVGVEQAMGREHEVTLMWPSMKFDSEVQSTALSVYGRPVVA